MKKIMEGLYKYKGVTVKKNYKDMYEATIYVTDRVLPITIMCCTQKSFKETFNRVVWENGGLKVGMYF